MKSFNQRQKHPDGPWWPVWKEGWSENTKLKAPLEDVLKSDQKSLFDLIFNLNQEAKKHND